MVGKGAPSPYFRAGESVSVSGIYRVFHADHRLNHDVTLLAGDEFPRCNKCGEHVHFELLQQIQRASDDRDFRRNRIYEIPHPEDTERKVS